MRFAGEQPFRPPRLLSNGHVQTVLGNRVRQSWVERKAQPMKATSDALVLCTSEGVRLQALASLRDGAPTVVIIHGWLGHADSSYVLSAAGELWAQGFSVIRLNLRDHGGTAHLNEEMFHSARTREVVEAVTQLSTDFATGPVGVLGYSLGGNFALRVARATGLPTLAVCPAVDPDRTMQAIDQGWMGYRLYFVRKWQQALASKQQAFPARYDFTRALELRSVSALTDHFVRDHTDYPSTRAYFDRYTLTGPALSDTEATVVYAADDPVIPVAGFADLAPGIELVPVARGGHCAFLDHPRRASWIDRYAADHFARRLGRAQITPDAPSSARRSAAIPSSSP